MKKKTRYFFNNQVHFLNYVCKHHKYELSPSEYHVVNEVLIQCEYTEHSIEQIYMRSIHDRFLKQYNEFYK